MNSMASLTERTIVAADVLINRVMSHAWASVCRNEFQRLQPRSEEDYGGGDICCLEETASTQDDQPLE
jgi:hypothetical protein